jgi:MATE family multidrug resistance protein
MTETSFYVSSGNPELDTEDDHTSSSWEELRQGYDCAVTAGIQTNKLVSLTNSPLTEPFQVLEEAQKLFHIALPSVLIQFSLFFIFPMSASAVGRNVGTVELAAFSLGSLIGNLTCLSIMEGALTAADTLMPRAFGTGQYEEVGRIAIRGTVVCLCLLLPPIIPLCGYGGWILETLGQDPDASQLAETWIRVYFLGVFPNLGFRILLRFLLCQHQPWPMVISSAVPCFLVHPILLRHLVPTMGLEGSALAIVLTQWISLFLLIAILVVKPMHKSETWPGLSWLYVKEALAVGPSLKFLHLSVGGIMSMNEWWFFEIMCFVAGSFGVIPLCVHTIAYNLVPLLFMIPLGILIGLTVRMGHVIVENPKHAKQMACWCMGLTAGIGAVVATLLHVFRYQIIATFTSDEEVIEGASDIWGHLCYYIFLLYIFGISQAILRALGMQWRMAAIISGFLYFFTLPAVVYFAVIRGGGLDALWTVLPIFYTILQGLLALGYVMVDWERHACTIREGIRRSAAEAKGLQSNETTLLLASPKRTF